MPTIPFLNEVSEENSRYIGAFIRYLRKSVGITQRELSYQTGYSEQTICRIETGKANAMGVAGKDLLVALASAIGCGNDALYDMYLTFVTENSDERFEIVS